MRQCRKRQLLCHPLAAYAFSTKIFALASSTYAITILNASEYALKSIASEVSSTCDSSTRVHTFRRCCRGCRIEIYAFADDGIEMLDLLRSVLAEHALDCSGTTKAVDTFEAEIALDIQTSILGEVAIGS